MNRIAPTIAQALSITVALALQACSSDEQAKSSRPAPTVDPATLSPKREDGSVNETTERMFQNPFDTEAVYFLSQKNGTPEALSVLIKRVSKDGTQYSRWLFNCKEHSSQNLGVALSIQALDKPENSMPSKSQPYEPATKLGAIATSVCP